MVPLLGAIVGCHYSVLWFGGRVIRRLGEWTCHCRVPLKGAVVVCYGLGGDDQLWGEWTWCHCWVPCRLPL